MGVATSETTSLAPIPSAGGTLDTALSVDLLDQVFNAARVGLCLVDPEGLVVRVNGEWLRSVGLTREAALGHHFFDLPSAPPELRRLHDEVRRGKSIDAPVRRRGRGACEAWYGVRLSPVALPSGVGILIAGMDVGDCESTEDDAALRRRLHVQSTPLAVIEWDASLKVIAWNPSAEALFGWSAEEAVGRQASFTVPESARAGVDEVMRQLLAGKGKRRNINENVTKDGRIITCEWHNTSLVGADGRVIGIASMALDVTEHSRAALALRESEERFRIAFQTSPDWVNISRVDDGVYIAVNEGFLKSTGWSEAEVLGRSSFDLHLWDDPADRVRLVGALKDRGSAENLEMRFRAKDGRLVLGLVSARLITINGESVLLSITRDIGDWKRALDEVRQSEARLRAFVESDVIGILFGDVEGRVYDCNDELARIIGRSREDLLAGKVSWVTITPQEDRAFDRAALVEATQAGHCRPYEKHYLRPDGTSVPVQVGYVLLEPDRRKSMAFILDMTERRRAEEALRRSEAFFRSVLQDSTDFWSVLDSEGRYKYLSSGSKSVVGWTEQELLGLPATERVHPDDVERVRSTLADVFAASGAVGRVTYRYRHQDGSWRVLDSRARNLLHDPNVRGVVVSRRDVTEQRHLEAQFQQSQKLESVGRLAGGVAHDFNNLLTVIQSCSETLKDDLEAGSSAQPELIDEIHAAGKRAAELTRQLLAFARKQVIAPVPLDLNAVVRGTERMLRRVLGEDVELFVNVEPALWNMRCDRGQVEQVILNLAVNARDAMPGGGRFVIATDNVHVEPDEAARFNLDQPGDFVMLVARDSGMGMSPEVKAHVFEPFFTTKPKGTGTGLGLATVYGIVKQSGGHIQLTSEPGEGTASEFLPAYARGSHRCAAAVASDDDAWNGVSPRRRGRPSGPGGDRPIASGRRVQGVRRCERARGAPLERGGNWKDPAARHGRRHAGARWALAGP